MRSWTRKKVEIVTPIAKSQTKMRNSIHQRQINLNQTLAPHCSRLSKWNEELSYLDHKFTGYAELNQLKESVLESEGQKSQNQSEQKDEDFHSKIGSKLKSKTKSKLSKRASISAAIGRLGRSDAVTNDKVHNVNNSTAASAKELQLDTEILLRQYLNCTHLVSSQRARAETVDEFIVPLNESKTKLRRIVGQFDNDIRLLQSKHDSMDCKYRALGQKRTILQSQIDNLVGALNATIEEENATLRAAVSTKNDLNVLKLEKKGYEILLQTSRSLASSYSRFLKDTRYVNVHFTKIFGTKKLSCILSRQ